MLIREARPDDFTRITEMGEPFWLLTPVAHLIPYEAAAVAYWCHVMHETGILYVVEIGGRVEGAAGAVFMPALGNLAYRVGAELFWWIEPSHRKGGAGKALLAALEAGAKEKGCKVFSMMAIEGIDTDAVQAIYEKNGYQPTERAFSKGFEQWDSQPLSQ